MNWLDRTNNLSFPIKAAVTVFCVAFALATTLNWRAIQRQWELRYPPAGTVNLRATSLQAYNPNLNDVQLMEDGELRALISDNGITTLQISRDGGRSWQFKSAVAPGYLIHLAFADANHGWAYGTAGVVAHR